MSVAYGKGKKGTATKLHSEIIRSHGECERCGKNQSLQTAHIISRRYSATRTLLNNAFCLCASCHFFFTSHPVEFAKFVEKTWASEVYDIIHELSQQVTKKDWSVEVERLKKLKDMDLKEARLAEMVAE